MLAAEGDVHKRMRRVGTPAFSIQNMRAFIPITFKKALELRDKWISLVEERNSKLAGKDSEDGKADHACQNRTRLDVCHWISRATFDVIGLAGITFSVSYRNPLINLVKVSTTVFLQYSTKGMNCSWLTKTCLRLLSLVEKPFGT